ncbi:MAG: hypothetical protein E7E88_15205 [Clostridium perfringens]|nr:hypothetical protein [Clostridium perfringens]
MINILKYILLIAFALKFIAIGGFENNLMSFIYIGFLMMFLFLDEVSQKIEKRKEIQ